MKIIAKPINVIAWFDNSGIPHPIRLKLEIESEGFKVIRIHKILLCNKDKLSGNEMFTFRCQSLINSKEIIFEIKYELNTCKWLLYKI